jgi:hypothetical protein
MLHKKLAKRNRPIMTTRMICHYILGICQASGARDRRRRMEQDEAPDCLVEVPFYVQESIRVVEAEMIQTR